MKVEHYIKRDAETGTHLHVSQGHRQLNGVVSVDQNLLNLSIHQRDLWGTVIDTTLIIPHIRGVSGINWNGTDDGYAFFIRIAGANGFKVCTGHQPLSTTDGDYAFWCKQLMVDMRHEILTVLNDYYQRPYCGEQLKLFKD